MEPKKALIAMSGGVDSAVAALLTQSEGLSCIGATMRLYDGESDDLSSTCCSLEDVEDARSVARRLGIPYHVFNFKADFEEQVISKFIRCYERGLTPNPCIDCNRYLKFEGLMHRAQVLGCDYVVTGHYARITQDPETGRYLLHRAADPSKDQSYVLYSLTQEQLAHTRFPLGGLSKPQVRQIALEHGFINAKKHDSQDICFVPDGDYVAFMERHTGKHYPAGDFLDETGRVVGKHKGAVAYTLGQRKGLGLAMGAPVYVCQKDMAQNTVTVGPNESLFRRELIAEDLNWFPFPALTAPMEVTAKARYNQMPQSATIYPEGSSVRVKFHQPQRALTPGQAVVFYDGDLVIGGGTITHVLPNV